MLAKITSYLLLSTCVLLFTGNGWAITSVDTTPSTVKKSTSDTISEQRYNYEMAKSSFSKKDWAAFSYHYSVLGDYPLVPYLDFALLKRDMDKLPFDRFDTFLAANRNSFLEVRARQHILHTLWRKKNWQGFLKYYNENIATTEFHCRKLYARVQIGDTDALNEVADVWISARSLPKNCDGLFSIWKKSGGLTQDIAWKRFNAAMAAGKTGLARYVAGLMSEKYKADANRYFKVHSSPNLIKQYQRFDGSKVRDQHIIAHGIKRIARRTPKTALYHWERYEAQYLFPKPVSTSTKRYIATRLMSEGHLVEAERLIKQSIELRQTAVIERIIRESLRNLQWDKVAGWIETLDEDSKNSDRWQYWLARSNAELLRTSTETPHDIYTRLSHNRSFYGFLSADKLNRNYSLEHQIAEVDQSTQIVVEFKPAVRRAKELWLRGNQSEAAAEWMFALRNMSAEELIAAGELALHWGWYNKGIQAMISGNHWDHLDIRFPLAYQTEVAKIASDTNLGPPLIFAIARQESAFAEKAKSSAGALGLMQLMPATAKQTARKTGIKHTTSDLLDPEHNITLGSHYLQELLGKFNGNRILATAAYNAGPHRVDKWIQRNELDLPYDVWIETIPFKETRGYVQNVLAYSVIYAYRMGMELDFITYDEANNHL